MDAFRLFVRKKGVRWAGAIFVALLGLLVLSSAKPTHAENERVITIYHDGTQQTIVTDAATVGDALKRANLSLNERDIAEPAPATKLIAPSYDVNIYRARPVTIVDGNNVTQVLSAHTSARQIAADAGIIMYDEDGYTISRIDDFIADGGVGLKLTIQRATPISFTLYGKTVPIRTLSKTVGDLLKEKNVVLGNQDGTNIPLATPITGGMTVQVWRNGAQTITEQQDVAFTTQTIRDANQPAGYKQVQTPGMIGKKMVTYQIVLRDGQEISREQIQSVVIQQPQAEVDVIGVQLGFTPAFQAALAKLRGCEAGGNYNRNSGNGYYGAYQYDISTWANYQGYARADLAPPEVQDQKAWLTYQKRGWAPWPACSVKLGLQDVYR